MYASPPSTLVQQTRTILKYRVVCSPYSLNNDLIVSIRSPPGIQWWPDHNSHRTQIFILITKWKFIAIKLLNSIWGYVGRNILTLVHPSETSKFCFRTSRNLRIKISEINKCFPPAIDFKLLLCGKYKLEKLIFIWVR